MGSPGNDVRTQSDELQVTTSDPAPDATAPVGDAGGGRGAAVTVLGAGPAGLTAAWVLSRGGVDVHVLEADQQVGGISRTAQHDGFRFDIGGHRFFTKSEDVQALWREMLPPDRWLRVQRLSRIFYRGRFFDYPLRATDALSKLGVVESVACVLSYLKARALPRRDVRNFEDWVVNHFGWRLYSIFFRTYTEKVWGRPCTEISADWAAQRIKGLSLLAAVRNMLPRRPGGPVIKTLIEQFDYPRLGPGQMWEHAADGVQERGGTVELGARVTALHHDRERVERVEVTGAGGATRSLPVQDVITTLPLRDLVLMMDPPAPPHVHEAADQLEYRDYVTVVLVVDREDVFPDNWIYIHEPEVSLGRVQNYKNWSPFMVPDTTRTALGLEYFTTAGDKDLWEMSDEDLISLGTREIEAIGLADPTEILSSTVVRVPKAYPVYDEHYAAKVAVIRTWLEDVATNLQTVGRNGMHKYNNQDHSMLAAMLAAKNLLGEQWDPWRVNTDAEYHEEAEDRGPTGRQVPGHVAPTRAH